MKGLLRATPFVLQGVCLECCFFIGACNERTFPLIPCRKRQSHEPAGRLGRTVYLL